MQKIVNKKYAIIALKNIKITSLFGQLAGKGAFTNYVYKRRGVGGQKNQLFVNHYTIENVNGGG